MKTPLFYLALAIGRCVNGEDSTLSLNGIAIACAEEGGGVIRTANFIVDADSPGMAREVAGKIEGVRRRIARRWFGADVPDWEYPVLVVVDELPPDSEPWAMTYSHKGDVRGITIRAPRHDIFSHSLPHEMTHALFVVHCGGELPLWASEGIAVSSEEDCPSRLGGARAEMGFYDLFRVREYPDDWRPFYGQSYSVVTYLVETFGRKEFLRFVRTGDETGGWNTASRIHFQRNIVELEDGWKRWALRCRQPVSLSR